MSLIKFTEKLKVPDEYKPGWPENGQWFFFRNNQKMFEVIFESGEYANAKYDHFFQYAMPTFHQILLVTETDSTGSRKIYKPIISFRDKTVKLQFIRQFTEAESCFTNGLMSKPMKGEAHLYRVGEEPDKDGIMLELSQKQLAGIRKTTIHRKKIILYQKVDGSATKMTKSTETSIKIEAKEDLDGTTRDSYADERSPLIFLMTHNGNLIAANTDSMAAAIMPVTWPDGTSDYKWHSIHSVTVDQISVSRYHIPSGRYRILTGTLPIGRSKKSTDSGYQSRSNPSIGPDVKELNFTRKMQAPEGYECGLMREGTLFFFKIMNYQLELLFENGDYFMLNTKNIFQSFFFCSNSLYFISLIEDGKRKIFKLITNHTHPATARLELFREYENADETLLMNGMSYRTIKGRKYYHRISDHTKDEVCMPLNEEQLSTLLERTIHRKKIILYQQDGYAHIPMIDIHSTYITITAVEALSSNYGYTNYVVDDSPMIYMISCDGSLVMANVETNRVQVKEAKFPKDEEGLKMGYYIINAVENGVITINRQNKDTGRYTVYSAPIPGMQSLPSISRPAITTQSSSSSSSAVRSSATTASTVSHSSTKSTASTTSVASSRQSTTSSASFTSRLLEDFSLQSLLGEGTFGKVFHVVDLTDERDYAVKRIELEDSSDSKHILREIAVASKLKHEGIVRYYHTWKEMPPTGWNEVVTLKEKGTCMFKNDGGSIFFHIKTELCESSLDKWLTTTKRTIPLAIFIFRQIASAVEYMHDYGVTHRDLKPANILMNRGNRIKIADFGLATRATITEESIRTCVGTPAYMAPEQMGEHYTSKVDIFAMGLILAELLVEMTFLKRFEYFTLLRFGQMVFDSPLPSEGPWRALVTMLTSSNPDLRPNCDWILAKIPELERL